MAQRLSRRLTPLALLATVLAAVPGPHDGAGAAVPGKNGRIAFVHSAGAGPLEEVFMVSWKRCSWSALAPASPPT